MDPLQKGEVYLDPSQYRRLIRAQRMTIMDGFTLGFGLFLFSLFLAFVGFLFMTFVATGGMTAFVEGLKR